MQNTKITPKNKSILVTGSNGLLGQQVVNALLDEGYTVTGVSTSKSGKSQHKRYQYISADLTQCTQVESIFKESEFSHVIHLAAIAHVFNGDKKSWSRYYRVNTLASRSVFECACAAKIPVFFASTVDVYGINEDEINENCEPHPIGYYATTKYEAEKIIIKLANQPYLICRFAPIYSPDHTRDINKRIYIRYPKLCFLIGSGMEYEFLSIDNAVKIITIWVANPQNMKDIINVSDKERFNTKKLLEDEKLQGRARFVIYIPKWAATCIKKCVDVLFWKKPFLRFTAYKILCPLRTDAKKRTVMLYPGK